MTSSSFTAMVFQAAFWREARQGAQCFGGSEGVKVEELVEELVL